MVFTALFLYKVHIMESIRNSLDQFHEIYSKVLNNLNREFSWTFEIQIQISIEFVYFWTTVGVRMFKLVTQYFWTHAHSILYDGTKFCISCLCLPGDILS